MTQDKRINKASAEKQGLHKMSRAEALVKARQIMATVGSGLNQVAIDGEQAQKVAQQSKERKAQSLVAGILRSAEMKVVTQRSGEIKRTTTGANKRLGLDGTHKSYDPIQVLADVEEQNAQDGRKNALDGKNNEKNSAMRTSQEQASYYILTSGLKGITEKFVSMFRGEYKKEYQATQEYAKEKKTAVEKTDVV